jgi:hypothetical protein
MGENSLAVAEAYYMAVGSKNVASVEKYFHPDVQFIGPLAKMTGKETVVEATKRFSTLFKTLKIRAKFSSGDQAVVIYDLECPAPVGIFSTASLMTFKEGLISKIELFYDARSFEKK